MTIIGQTYGKLTAVRTSNRRKNGKKQAWFKCSCGSKERLLREDPVRYGKTKSCGCAKVGPPRTEFSEKMQGMRFGKLVALEHVMEWQKRQRKSAWVCQCDCGKTKKIWETNLTGGLSKSCGCVTYEKITTHGLSNSKFAIAFTAIKGFCQRNFLPFPWVTFASFAKERHADYLEYKNTHSNHEPSFEFSGTGLRSDKSQWAWEPRNRHSMGKNRKSMSSRWFTFEGESGNLLFWGKKLGVSRERARQLMNIGKLEGRILAIKKRK